MSQENVEIVRKAWEAAWSKPPDWAVLGALYHPDHVFESDYGGVNNTAYRGAAGFQAFLADQDETWDDWRHDLVAAVTRLVHRGGLEVQLEAARGLAERTRAVLNPSRHAVNVRHRRGRASPDGSSDRRIGCAPAALAR